MSQGLKDQLLQEVWECGDWDGDQDGYGITWCPVVIYEDDEEYGDIAGFYIATGYSSGIRELNDMGCEGDMDHKLEALDQHFSKWVLAGEEDA